MSKDESNPHSNPSTDLDIIRHQKEDTLRSQGRGIQVTESIEQTVAALLADPRIAGIELTCQACRRTIVINNDEITKFRTTGWGNNLHFGKSPFMCRECRDNTGFRSVGVPHDTASPNPAPVIEPPKDNESVILNGDEDLLPVEICENCSMMEQFISKKEHSDVMTALDGMPFFCDECLTKTQEDLIEAQYFIDQTDTFKARSEFDALKNRLVYGKDTIGAGDKQHLTKDQKRELKELKEHIRQRHKYKCSTCGKSQDDNKSRKGKQYKLGIYKVDKNGEFTEDNMYPLCLECAYKRSGKGWK